MSVTSGFFNSVANDRRYEAQQMSAIFDGIIADGVFMSIDEQLLVSSNAGMSVCVSPGKAWFNRTWTKNDSTLVLTIDAAEAVLKRIDIVALEVNSSESVRANTIKVIKGTPGSTPVAPTLTRTDTINQYPLAHVYVDANVVEILQAKITNKVGTSECPFVTGILDTVNIDVLLIQWEAEFADWFETLENILDENTAGNLLNLINAVDDKCDTKAQFKSGSGTFPSGNTTYVVNDSFVTAATLVIISPTQTKVGNWSVSSAAGSFTITSDATESANVTFDWGGTK